VKIEALRTALDKAKQDLDRFPGADGK